MARKAAKLATIVRIATHANQDISSQPITLASNVMYRIAMIATQESINVIGVCPIII